MLSSEHVREFRSTKSHKQTMRERTGILGIHFLCAISHTSWPLSCVNDGGSIRDGSVVANRGGVVMVGFKVNHRRLKKRSKEAVENNVRLAKDSVVTVMSSE